MGIHFDNTITIGNVLTFIVLIGGGGIFMFRIGGFVQSIQVELHAVNERITDFVKATKERFENSDHDMRRAHERIDDIALKMARSNGR